MNTNAIFFIDGRVTDSASLIAELPEGSECYLLDRDRDGINQMATILAGRSGVASIHVISHGSAGLLLLGNATLDAGSLPGYEDALAAIGNSLTESGDILLYGCNVAQGEVGQAFIEQIASLSGADVAASTDLTGSGDSGGDWVLEYSAGDVRDDGAAIDVDHLAGDPAPLV